MEVKKLHIGCECNILPGWIHYDIRKMREEVIELDVRKGIPHDDNTVSHIYGGNFLDHLTYYEGLSFLKECYRVLEVGGIAQFSVMNTDKIINDYLLGAMGKYNDLQPLAFSSFSNSTKFATFLLGNLAYGEKDYTGHRMLYTIPALIEIGEYAGFLRAEFVKPDFTREPWSVENPDYASHNLYVTYIKQVHL